MSEEERKLVELIRRVAKDLFYELLDEHLDDYEHEEKKRAPSAARMGFEPTKLGESRSMPSRWGEDEKHGVRL